MQAPLFSNDKLPNEGHCVSFRLPITMPSQCQAIINPVLLQVAVPDFAFGGWPEAFLPPWASTRCVPGGLAAFPASRPVMTLCLCYVVDAECLICPAVVK